MSERLCPGETSSSPGSPPPTTWMQTAEPSRRLIADRLLAHAGLIDFPLARSWMCRELRGRGITADVLAIMGVIPRHAFAPPQRWRGAYVDQDLWTGTTWMTSPGVVARVADALPRTPGTRTMEIGTGTGYQTAVLAGMGHEVVSVDVSWPCVADAATRLRALGATGVRLLAANGLKTGTRTAQFDAVAVNAALPEAPTALTGLLAADGVLVTPVVLADGSQRLMRYTVTSDTVTSLDLGPCRFEAIVLGE